MANNELHGVDGIRELCGRLGPGWECQGTETSGGFFVELFKVNTSTKVPRHCPSFLLSEEHKYKFGVRAFLYAGGLAYCFLGLAVITGIYMKALDCIVKQTRKVVREDPVTGIRVFKEKKIWNPAVADITLLALGTCAPQVSLAIIDSLKHLGEKSASELGAGTLLGSTVFNLFPILAVCVVAPKDFRIKKLSNMGVYIVELVWSIWAYVWLFLILQVWTPNVITVWEAVLTILQFPILILHAFIQDKNWKYVSIPWNTMTTVDTVNCQELSVISQSSESAIRYYDGSESSADKAMQQRNEGNQDDFEDMDTEHDVLDGFLRDRTQEASENSYSWKEIGLLWRNQFFDAMTVKGSDDDTGRKLPPSMLQLLLHPLVSHWQISFAFIPPVQLLHGWLAFCCSICFITLISYTVVELANLFDCVTGFSSYVVAMTVLATGTSFPNLVASKIAAEEYETADSAIANINASNCINVYVGFGIPWCISAIYNSAHHQQLMLPAGGLGFVLSVYFATFILCITALTARRKFLGGELGGSRRWAWASAAFFLLLWATFLLLACLGNRYK